MRLGRRRPPALPEGLWRDDFDRIDRACGRVLQVGGAGLDPRLLEVLTALRAEAWSRCVAAAALDPRTAAEVPGDTSAADLHHRLTRAANRVAQAAQALVMGGDGAPAAARRALDQAAALVAEQGTPE